MLKSVNRKPIIAVAQMRYFDWNKKDNVEKIKHFIRLAKKKKADIVCFPEMTVHKTQVLHVEHELILQIREECKKNSIWCILSENLKFKNKIYNAAILIDRRGGIKGHYKKINLLGDNEYVSPGKNTFVFKTDFAKIGIVLCWDLAYPKLFRAMKKKGVEIVFCPAQWMYEVHAHHARKYEEHHKKRERQLLKSMIRTRAFENLIFVALCNPVTDEKDLVSYSAIVSPHHVLNEIVDKEGLIVSKINLDELKKLKKLYEDAY